MIRLISETDCLFFFSGIGLPMFGYVSFCFYFFFCMIVEGYYPIFQNVRIVLVKGALLDAGRVATNHDGGHG